MAGVSEKLVLDTYPELIVPDDDVRTALKVIRTIRDAAYGHNDFERIVLLSHAHASILKAVEESGGWTDDKASA